MATHKHPELVFGGAVIGLSFTDTTSLDPIFRTLNSNGVKAIDTAARYPPTQPGRSEELLGESNAAQYGFALDTKVSTASGDGSGDLLPAASRGSLERSLQRLNVEKIRTYYIHRPDPQTPVVEQARGLDELYREGKVESIGVSNFSAAQVEEFVKVCEENGFVKPTVYQGCYNVIEREMESELLPVLRKYGIKFVAYRAVAAGFLAGNMAADGKEGTRFAKDHPFAGAMKQIYGGEKAKKAYELLKSALVEGGDDCVDPIETALRWICFHSALTEKDAVLLGASKEAQLKQNLEAVRKGPLPEGIAAKLSQIWPTLHA